MRAGVAVAVLWLVFWWSGQWRASAHAQYYAFYREMGLRRDEAGRRVFGAGPPRLSAWPAACALLDRYLSSRCSCAVLAPRWALTAAHCVVPAVTAVQYHGQEPADSYIAPVYLLYAHPEYHTVAKERRYGPEVVVLRHDIGLVRTREDMRLQPDYFSPRSAPPAPPGLEDEPRGDSDPGQDSDPVVAIMRYDVHQLVGHQVNVLGFGVTEQKLGGERLREELLRLVACEQEGWHNCACAQGTARAVCAGDSGGPVVYNGTQIGVTSMGPVECGLPRLEAGREARSVFTALLPYAGVINATMHDAPAAFRMRVVSSAAVRRAALPRTGAGTLLSAVSLLLCRSV